MTNGIGAGEARGARLPERAAGGAGSTAAAGVGSDASSDGEPGARLDAGGDAGPLAPVAAESRAPPGAGDPSDGIDDDDAPAGAFRLADAPRPALAAPLSSGIGLRRRGVLATSVLNPGGRGNTSGADPALATLVLARGDPDDRRVATLDPRRAADPGAVRDAAVSGIHPDVAALVRGRAPASAVARRLCEIHGGYTADNTAERRAAIVASLRWITTERGPGGDVGLAYDHERAARNPVRTQSPNETLERGSGICRDFATCAAAILAALASARRRPDGSWRLGSPTGQESRVQAFGYGNPTELHAFTAFRDPVTGRWDTLEYGTSYRLQGRSVADAVASTLGSLAGYYGYRIDGWDGTPVPVSHRVVAAARANDFFELDPGTAEAGELRPTAGASDARLEYFATSRLSLVSSIDPSALSNGLRAGLKVSYHDDFESVSDGCGGYLHLAGGVYTDFADSSRWTGRRGEADRARYSVVVLAVQADGRKDLDPMAIAGEHLRLELGADWNVRLGVPLSFGPGARLVSPESLWDHSRVDVGADAVVSGRERLPAGWQLDWGLRLRGQVDLVGTAVEAVFSGASVRRGLVLDPPRATFALALSREAAGGLVTRIEVGGTQFLAPPLDASAGPTATHYAVLSVAPASGVASFGILARGETVEGRLVPADGIGVALELAARPGVHFGASAEATLPGGDWRRAAERLSVHVGLETTF